MIMTTEVTQPMASFDKVGSADDNKANYILIDGTQWFLYEQGMQRQDIPDGVTHILVKEGVKSIEQKAFDNSLDDGKFDALQHVKMATTVLKIGYQAFWGCHAVEQVGVPEEAEELIDDLLEMGEENVESYIGIPMEALVVL